VLIDDTLATPARGPLVAAGIESMRHALRAFAGEHVRRRMYHRAVPARSVSLAKYWWVIVVLPAWARAWPQAGVPRLAHDIVSAEGTRAEIAGARCRTERDRRETRRGNEARRAALKARLKRRACRGADQALGCHLTIEVASRDTEAGRRRRGPATVSGRSARSQETIPVRATDTPSREGWWPPTLLAPTLVPETGSGRCDSRWLSRCGSPPR